MIIIIMKKKKNKIVIINGKERFIKVNTGHYKLFN